MYDKTHYNKKKKKKQAVNIRQSLADHCSLEVKRIILKTNHLNFLQYISDF